MKKHFTILLLLFTLSGFAQNNNGKTPNWKKFSTPKGNVAFCYFNNGWVKVKCNISKKAITTIQKKLKFLGYSIIKTRLYDTQTKRELQKFNEGAGLKSYPYVLDQTQKKLNIAYRKKKRELKKHKST